MNALTRPAAFRGVAGVAPVRITVIVTNHNYGRFLPECLGSVAAQTYPSVDCIVVDDGSTDESREVLARFPEVTALFQANAGQTAATRHGLAHASGDVVILLDADDFLLPDACAEIAGAWTADTVSLHFRLQTFRDGEFQNEYWPQDTFCRHEDAVRHLFAYGYVPAAPNSGNAYARSYVDLIFREATALGFNSIDSTLAYSAPLVGVTRYSERALGAYRVHDSNMTDYSKRRAVSRARMHLFYSYHAQMTARKLAIARAMSVPSWTFLCSAYELKLYLTLRGSALTSLGLPDRAPLSCAIEAARLFSRQPRLSLKRRAANVAIVLCLAVAPPRLRRLIGERFYNLDFSR